VTGSDSLAPMFIGHLAVGLAAKRAAPRASLGAYVMASVFLDLLWPLFLIAGVERVVIAPGITSFSPFDFVSYPWSHSLGMAAFWALVFGWAHYAIRRDRATAKMLGLVVFSHWVLDWITHRPDLQLLPGVPFRTGLSLWSSIPGTIAVETAMFLAAAWWYESATEPLDAAGRWGWYSLVGAWLIAYAASIAATPKPGQETALAYGSLSTWLFIPWAAWTDRHRVFQ